MHGVLAIEKQDVFLQADALDFVMPDGESAFQAKLGEVMRSQQVVLGAVQVMPTNVDRGAIGEANRFGEVVEHDHASKGSRQTGDQQAVIAPGDKTSDRAGGVAA